MFAHLFGHLCRTCTMFPTTALMCRHCGRCRCWRRSYRGSARRSKLWSSSGGPQRTSSPGAARQPSHRQAPSCGDARADSITHRGRQWPGCMTRALWRAARRVAAQVQGDGGCRGSRTRARGLRGGVPQRGGPLSAAISHRFKVPVLFAPVAAEGRVLVLLLQGKRVATQACVPLLRATHAGNSEALQAFMVAVSPRQGGGVGEAAAG
jgi:hypothetical protein